MEKEFLECKEKLIKNGNTHTGRAIKDFERNGIKVYLENSNDPVKVKSEDEEYISTSFSKDNGQLKEFHVKKIK
jgi:hypothetical protein